MATRKQITQLLQVEVFKEQTSKICKFTLSEINSQNTGHHSVTWHAHLKGDVIV